MAEMAVCHRSPSAADAHQHQDEAAIWPHNRIAAQNRLPTGANGCMGIWPIRKTVKGASRFP
ncbi:MAG: hypothetical protein IJ111_15340 [Eggerthellaceae bacterium]|nr:hypothetical protein [Eggerthellaceae bacterium]MBQ9044177.1 hypothetical protein [Eggerthellaceae bacterium]